MKTVVTVYSEILVFNREIGLNYKTRYNHNEMRCCVRKTGVLYSRTILILSGLRGRCYCSCFKQYAFQGLISFFERILYHTRAHASDGSIQFFMG